MSFLLAEPEFTPPCPDPSPALSLAEMSQSAQEEYWSSLALRHCPGLGVRSQARLLKHFGSAAAACRNYREWTATGINAACARNFAKGQWNEGARKEWNAAGKSKSVILLWVSSGYPQLLRELPDAPSFLYCAGDLSLLHGPCLAIVGTRLPTSQGRSLAAQLAAGISGSGITVASGMALGIDREAHCASLPEAGKSIGVLGTGIDVIYPRSNTDLFARMKEDGLLVSEFAPDAAPVARNFPVRNRIISGLSLGVVVVEAAMRSGSLLTARLALEQNREIFAVISRPEDERNAGCHNLIRQGATCAASPDDILRELAPRLQSFAAPSQPVPCSARSGDLLTPPELSFSREPSVSPEAEAAATALLGKTDSDRVLAVLQKRRGASKDQILDETGLASGQLDAALIALELLDRIRLLPGNRYEAI